jgi:hypothetical protein
VCLSWRLDCYYAELLAWLLTSGLADGKYHLDFVFVVSQL